MIMKKIFTLIVMLAATLGMQAQDTWTVAGEKAILGVNWDPTAVENDMISTDGENFILAKTEVMLAAKEAGYGFKVCKNHAWDESYGGDGPDGNYMLPIAEDGQYTVTFKFNATTHEISATAEKTGEYVAPSTDDQTYTIAGVPELCGTEWNAADETNDMSSTDGINYTLVKEGVILEGGRGYGFKVVVDHSWGESYPSANYMLTVAENGTYTVTFKFNKETKEVGADAVRTGDAVIADKVWTIAGVEAVLGSNWDPTDTNNDMTDAGDGTFILVKKNVALLADTEYEFKVLANHSWSENYGADGIPDNPTNITFMVDEDGVYDVTFTFNPEDKTCWASADLADTTGISTVKAAANNGMMYNLQGQRVQAGFRGIAIQNGRKVVVK